MNIPISVPLDSDGCLRRECPTCEREFKWRPTPEGEQGAPVPEGGFFCPYCAVQAPPGSWWTKPQLEAAASQAFDAVVNPQLGDLEESMERASGDFIKVSISGTDPPKPPALTEIDDMRLVEFSCHPTEPVKILDDWDRHVHCLLCGQIASSLQ
jgi:hypothetical protein